MKVNCLDGYSFFVGVPDSQLKSLCNYLMSAYGIGPRHIIAANEGNCVGLAAGYYLATGKVPVVYLQNSGIGNIINPVASLLNDEVYGIPCIFIVGWRGEPGFHDEPQHIYQGKITIQLLEDIGIQTFVVSKDTTDEEILAKLEEFQSVLDKGKQVAFVVRKDAIDPSVDIEYRNNNSMLREDVIRHVVAITDKDIVVSTTGKASRELFEIREARSQFHDYDFLTVGSMGHSSSIALGIALQKTDRKIWCIDGDGALLMHMGSMALIGTNRPKNMVHIVINNSAHESVGGMPTVAGDIDLVRIAEGCGYPNAVCVNDFASLDEQLRISKDRDELSFIEAKCAIGARNDLGRPTLSPKQNKSGFMRFLSIGSEG